LRVRDRDQRHVVELREQRGVIRQVERSVERRQRRYLDAPQQREVDEVGVEVHDVEGSAA
jgi:hypothetical protein